jgi:hypothetical protein
MLIELGDHNRHNHYIYTSLSSHITQGYKVDVLEIPTFRLSFLSLNQLNSAGYMATFGSGKCSILLPSSPSIIITGNYIKDRYSRYLAHTFKLTASSSSYRNEIRSHILQSPFCFAYFAHTYNVRLRRPFRSRLQRTPGCLLQCQKPRSRHRVTDAWYTCTQRPYDHWFMGTLQSHLNLYIKARLHTLHIHLVASRYTVEELHCRIPVIWGFNNKTF